MKRVALPSQRTEQENVAQADRGLVDVEGLAVFLSLSVRTTERLVAEGAPCFDFGRHHPKRRPKALRRFDCQEVLAWLRARRNGNGDAT